MSKRKRPAPGSLDELATDFTCRSHADGTIRITPKWRKGGGGVLSRLAFATRVSVLLNKHWEKP